MQSNLPNPGVFKRTYGPLTEEQIKALETEQIQSLTTEQIQSLTAKQIKALIAKQIKALIAKQIQALQIQYLTAKQIQALKPEQIQALTEEQIQSLTAKQIDALKPEQIQALQIQALKPEQFRALFFNILTKSYNTSDKTLENFQEKLGEYSFLCVINREDSRQVFDYMHSKDSTAEQFQWFKGFIQGCVTQISLQQELNGVNYSWISSVQPQNTLNQFPQL